MRRFESGEIGEKAAELREMVEEFAPSPG
jgi:hypothetical protein